MSLPQPIRDYLRSIARKKTPAKLAASARNLEKAKVAKPKRYAVRKDRFGVYSGFLGRYKVATFSCADDGAAWLESKHTLNMEKK